MVSKVKKIDMELLLFTLCIFLQNFAIIKTSSFGISCLSVFLVFIFLKYRYYRKLNINIILFIAITIFFIILDLCFNDVFNVFQIARYFLIFFVAYTGYFYLKDIFKNGKQKKLFNYMFRFTTLICIYGIYQFYASQYKLPMFLNIFNNNPSYAVRGIYEIYGGWSSTNRIYATFFEPSIYAIFLTNLFFLFVLYKKEINVDKLNYKFTILLSLINIFLTFSRAGWVIFLCYLIIYVYNKFLSKYGILNKITRFLIINLPFIVLAIMYFVGLLIFKDNSSFTRTYSSLYYLKHSFDKAITIIFGHGLGTISISDYCITFHKTIIEPFTHNGYIEIIYQLGCIYFVYLVFVINRFIAKNVKNNIPFAYASVSTMCCFGALYNVDTLVIVVLIVICFSKFYNRGVE